MFASRDSASAQLVPPEVASAVAVVAENLRVALGSIDRVRPALDTLGQWLVSEPESVAPPLADELLPLVGLRRTAMAEAVFELFEEHVARFPRPLGIVAGLLDARNEQLQRRAALLGQQLAALGCPDQDPQGVDAIAARCIALPGVLDHPPSLAALGALLGGEGALADQLLAAPSPGRRRLAAWILDAAGLPDHELARSVLGRANADELRPYLEYTRATHLDLVVLTPKGPGDVPCLASIACAGDLIPRGDLAQLIGKLGWARVCWGVTVERIVGTSVEGGLPYRVDHQLASLLDDEPSTRREWERLVLVAEGESGSSQPPTKNAEVLRFRRYNVAHAELLEAILEVAPLTRAKAEFVLQRMSAVVEDFQHLFGSHTADGADAVEKYRGLRTRIESSLTGDGATLQSSTTARLVQMFEEPRSIDEVTTLHGLKRYLHQRGLRYAFRLFGTATANRVVDVAVLEPERSPRIAQVIRYVDFEPERGRLVPGFPLAVSLIVEAFAAYLLHGGTARLPTVDVLAYGNEVQIYLHYHNHPAFLRLDLSSPRDGGMLDLEYFAVSQNELDNHPDLELNAIRHLLTNLDFDVECDSLHLRVRYDKERAMDLEDLIDHVRYLLSVAPYLMDLDWIVAGLDYPPTARRRVVDAWTRYVTHHAVLPVDLLLTEDRRRILQSERLTPTGIDRVPWDGESPYEDRYSCSNVVPLAARLERTLKERGLEQLAAWGEARARLEGQRLLDRVALRPLRDAIARGELTAAGTEFALASRTLFCREHEAVRLARLLVVGGPDLVRAARVAAVVSRLERVLFFQTSGAVQGRAVERANLRVGRCPVGVFVLRDELGAPRIAVAAAGGVLYRHRERADLPWSSSEELEPEVLAEAWVADGVERLEVGAVDIDALRTALLAPQMVDDPRRVSDTRTWPAVVAAPGRASGFVRFMNARMSAKDAADAVLVAPAFRPADAPLIAKAAGLVSTGGGVLSHAGITALELGIPALVVAAQWAEGPIPRLVRKQVRHADERIEVEGLSVTVRREQGEDVDVIEEGDLVVVDASVGALSIMGQDPDALAIFRELGSLHLAATAIERAGRSPAMLVERGRMLRCVHQLDKLLGRLTAASVARYAVRELVLPQAANDTRVAWPSVGLAERSQLVARLLDNRVCGQTAREELAQLHDTVSRQLEQLAGDALAALPRATNVFQIGCPWLRVLRVRRIGEQMNRLLGTATGIDTRIAERLDAAARARIQALRGELEEALQRELRQGALWSVRHTLRALEQADSLAGEERAAAPSSEAARRALTAMEVEWLGPVEGSLVVSDDAGGIELAPLIGAKAANLGEIRRILGEGKVPRWVAVTDRALRQTLDQPLGRRGTLENAIREVLERSHLPVAAKADEIQRLWARAKLPAEVRDAIVAGYRQLLEDAPEAVIAVRSSAFEEDTERQPWAGQFATFLGVRGEDAVLEHVRLSWAALWSQVVLARRQQLGADQQTQVASGVVLQRLVDARVSGVLFTASPAVSSSKMVLNVGLGLGEGVVSGLAEVDLVLVSRPTRPHDPLELEYKVADKRHRVVLTSGARRRTRVADVPYHQRLRPALEFVEIEELVAAALKLEGVMRHPLDIEFAFEGPHLRILQVRPVPVFHASLASPLLRQAARGAFDKGESS